MVFPYRGKQLHGDPLVVGECMVVCPWCEFILGGALLVEFCWLSARLWPSPFFLCFPEIHRKISPQEEMSFLQLLPQGHLGEGSLQAMHRGAGKGERGRAGV